MTLRNTPLDDEVTPLTRRDRRLPHRAESIGYLPNFVAFREGMATKLGK